MGVGAVDFVYCDVAMFSFVDIVVVIDIAHIVFLFAICLAHRWFAPPFLWSVLNVAIVITRVVASLSVCLVSLYFAARWCIRLHVCLLGLF